MAAFFTSTGWLIAGFVLLAAEMFLPGVYLLFFGIGAVAIGANLLFFPALSWVSQIAGFAIVSFAAALIGYRWYGTKPDVGEGDVNRPTQRLIGRRAVVSQALVNGRGRVKLEDSWWNAEGPDMPEGTAVLIEGASGSLLHVVPASPTRSSDQLV
ncbi:NfeD family protein [Aureimonas fodinaquatilis]|uniref:NfeD family protein n=1 Tax=Aureimonas fodinaquatilis TaxID=2565783 RepID=A0A5B0E167_9HYPH|nr:NfeD family protein [Aureimonas fodinaquatilis]KAA0972386.1 NfeD family protein [Aureimonas fodinaquatilis]